VQVSLAYGFPKKSIGREQRALARWQAAAGRLASNDANLATARRGVGRKIVSDGQRKPTQIFLIVARQNLVPPRLPTLPGGFAGSRVDQAGKRGVGVEYSSRRCSRATL
jgi:hypothetical protein